MRKVMISVAALALAIVVTSCATLPMESKLEKPVSMTQTTKEPGRNFAEEKRALWLFGGLIELSLPEVDQVVGPAVADHTGVQNLKITTQISAIDLLLSALTSGVIYSRTVIIEGEVYD